MIHLLERATIALERIATALEQRPANDTKTPRKPALRKQAEVTELVRVKADRLLRDLGLG